MNGEIQRQFLDDDPTLREIVRRLADTYRPLRIYLFGSKARGTAGPGRDFDLFVVVSDDAPPELKNSKLAYHNLCGGRGGQDGLGWTHGWVRLRAAVITSLPPP